MNNFCDTLPSHSKVWLHIANRNLTDKEIQTIEKELTMFVKDWQTHGKPLVANYCILLNQILIVGVDQKTQIPSGCSIDKLMRLLQQAGAEMNVNFFDRLKTPIIQNEGIRLISKSELSTVKSDDVCFNMICSTIEDLKTSAVIPIQKSWMFAKTI